VFSDFYVAALCNLGFTICGSYIRAGLATPGIYGGVPVTVVSTLSASFRAVSIHNQLTFSLPQLRVVPMRVVRCASGHTGPVDLHSGPGARALPLHLILVAVRDAPRGSDKVGFGPRRGRNQRCFTLRRVHRVGKGGGGYSPGMTCGER